MIEQFDGPFAQALAATGHIWHRRPSNRGFHRLLLTDSDTASFNPESMCTKEQTSLLGNQRKHVLSDAVAGKLRLPKR